MKPKRIQRRRAKGWKMPAETLYVGRPGKYGNPFHSGDRAADVEKFRLCVSEFPVPLGRIKMWREAGGSTTMLVLLAARVPWVINELRGKDLCCWCKLSQPCHADILLKLVNGA